MQYLAHGCWCHAAKCRQSVKSVLSHILQQRPYAEHPIAVLAKAVKDSAAEGEINPSSNILLVVGLRFPVPYQSQFLTAHINHCFSAQEPVMQNQ